MICLNTVQYRGSLACLGRLTTMRMLLDKYSPPQGRTNECTTNVDRKEADMCFDPRDIEQNDQATEQNETNVPATVEPVTTEEPVAA